MHKLLVFFVLTALAPAQSQNHAIPANDSTHPQPSQQTAQNKPAQNESTSSSNGLLNYLGAGLTVVIALAACVQAVVSVWQARVYERQYEAMSKQVEASNKSAEAALKGVLTLEKLERPFLMIELRGEQIKTQVWIVNKGKVPAQIIWYNPSGTLIFPTHEEMEKLPDDYSYGYLYNDQHSEAFNVPWIAPDAEMELGSFDWTIMDSLDEETIRQYRIGAKVALFLSTVKYRGMLTETIFESRWCFRWVGKDHGGLKLYGPYGYNKYT